MSKTRGIIFIRKCLESQIHHLKQVYSLIEHKLTSKKQISWINTYLNGQFCSDLSSEQRISHLNFATNLLREIHFHQNFTIGSIGYFNSPAGHVSDQKFHVDYNNKLVRQIFIPLVDLTTKNSTQFLKMILSSEKLRMDDVELLSFLDQQGIKSYEVTQIVTGAFTILDMEEMVFHRGISNRSLVDRPMFFINYAFDQTFQTPDEKQVYTTEQFEQFLKKQPNISITQKNQEIKLSKNEQKRLQKQKKIEIEKAEKAIKKLELIKDKSNSMKSEQILDPIHYFQNRSKMICELRKFEETNPYPHKFDVAQTIAEFIEKYGPITTNGLWIEEDASIAGRIQRIRWLGKNLAFIDIKQEGERLQIFCNSSNYKGNRNFEDVIRVLRRGDIIGVVGKPGRTNTDELSIAPGEIKLLSPCLHMLPDTHIGFKDRQTRYRKRYLDLIMNDRTRETFILRSKVLSFIRKYLTNLNFVEVETPMMNLIPGGATAKPFTTYHNDLDMKLFMRIAPQLFLKQCVVGGMQRVFEIGKNFRNQSIDQTHNPEYTECEFYMAYADYNDLIRIAEDMISNMVKEITGSFIVKHHPDPDDNPDKILEIDFTPPWRKISMMQELQTCLGQLLPTDLESEQAQIFFDKQCKKHNVDCSNPRSTIRLIDKLVARFLQSQCLHPTFIIQHPQSMSPLAKYHRNKPGLTERFELFIKYHEFCNAYTELNDPFIQKELLLTQAREKEKGDEESMFYDEVFVNALEHGLPPTGGFGLGIHNFIQASTESQ